MLTLTDTAKAAIAEIVSQAGLPEGGGVRISLTDAEQIEMALSPQPEAGDEVVDESGARVFVTQSAGSALTGHTLDAEQTEDGVGFALRPSTD